MGIDLKRLTAKQALSLAKGVAGMTNDELAEALGQDHSSVKRYFNENDREYYPSLFRIPKLCQALGNTILLDWIQVQLEDGGDSPAITSDSDLLRRLNRLAGELGGVHRSVDDTLSGPGLDNFDPKRLLAELIDVEHQVRELRRSLQQASGERLDSEGWQAAVAKGE
jgi:transcriptional regulator with XRE-family HTH domain